MLKTVRGYVRQQTQAEADARLLAQVNQERAKNNQPPLKRLHPVTQKPTVQFTHDLSFVFFALSYRKTTGLYPSYELYERIPAGLVEDVAMLEQLIAFWEDTDTLTP